MLDLLKYQGLPLPPNIFGLIFGVKITSTFSNNLKESVVA